MANKQQLWFNQPQSLSLIPDIFMFMAGGMNLALGLGWSFYRFGLHFKCCWFIGVIAGAILAAPLSRFLSKRYYVLISSFMITVAGIAFTAAPFSLPVLITARYIDGIGVGFTTVPFIVHASEITAKSNRAFCLTFEQLGMGLGICMQAILTSQWTAGIDFSPNRVHGTCCLIFGLVALGTAYLTIESPIYYIRRSDDANAVDSLICLQRPAILTDEKKVWLDALHHYVHANVQLSYGQSFVQGLVPLLKMLLVRSLLAFTFSTPFSVAMHVSSFATIGSIHAWPLILYGILRVLGTLSVWPMLDLVGRKAISVLSVFLVSGLTIGLSWVSSTGSHMSVACLLLLILQIFDGMFAPTTSTYLGEAFPLLWKPYFIAFCIVVQNIVHIVVIVTFKYNNHNLFVYSTFICVYMFLGSILFWFILPETKGTTLAIAQKRFQRWFYLKFK